MSQSHCTLFIFNSQRNEKMSFFVFSLMATFVLVPAVSLSNSGGGIGPHTDDYDVFLIQMSGRRKWDIGKRTISTKEELQNLQNGLDPFYAR